MSEPLYQNLYANNDSWVTPTPWTEEPGRVQSTGLHRFGHNWSNLGCTHAQDEYMELDFVVFGEVGAAWLLLYMSILDSRFLFHSKRSSKIQRPRKQSQNFLGNTTFWGRLPRWYSGKESACQCGDTKDAGSVSALGRSGGGDGNPLQYYFLENSMDRGAWRAIVHRVTNSQIQLSNWAHTARAFRWAAALSILGALVIWSVTMIQWAVHGRGSGLGSYFLIFNPFPLSQGEEGFLALFSQTWSEVSWCQGIIGTSYLQGNFIVMKP